MDTNHHRTVPGLAAPELAHHDVVDLAPLGTAATHAVVTPASEKAPDTPHVGGPMQSKTQISIFRQTHRHSKQFATLRMQVPLPREFTLQEPAVGSFLVACWGRRRQIPDLDSATALLRQAGDHHG